MGKNRRDLIYYQISSMEDTNTKKLSLKIMMLEMVI